MVSIRSYIHEDSAEDGSHYPATVEEIKNQIVTIGAQRSHIQSIPQCAAVSVTVLPVPELDAQQRKNARAPVWGQPLPELVEFGDVHVQSSTLRQRTILLSNESNSMANWRLVHVGRHKKQLTAYAKEIGMTGQEVEECCARDDPSAFCFDAMVGSITGPTKVTRVLPHASSGRNQEKNMPARINITFKPEINELYKCHFRLEIDGGKDVDFVCRGCGSYDEEDDQADVMDFLYKS
eukprot:gnl/MRDRNA2_/MRDRNA2_110807_c0_seq1.p1 gnl/MRDRNA2_/MRDRNA2_110807_c0~~gnl/MRDRNA2_/MRDRNA2_110807_c0_seq1.p1  ORF type:complete len:236 (-),score=41.52 gnl/MRDRNA2_/MRDRNA2_110807_c0_seq1:88-795(-)